MREISFHFVITVFVVAEAKASFNTCAFNAPKILRSFKSTSLTQPLITSSHRSTKLFSKKDVKISTKYYNGGETNDRNGMTKRYLWDSPWDSSMVTIVDEYDSFHHEKNTNKRVHSNGKVSKELKTYYEANAFVANELKWVYSSENVGRNGKKETNVHAFFQKNTALANKKSNQSTLRTNNLMTESSVYRFPVRPQTRKKSSLIRFLVSNETSALKDHTGINDLKERDIDKSEPELELNSTLITTIDNKTKAFSSIKSEPAEKIETKAFSLIMSETAEKIEIQVEQSANITESKKEDVVEVAPESFLSIDNETTAMLNESTKSEMGVIQDFEAYEEIEQEPLEIIGDWGAYYDDDDTGSIYFYNVKTGESTWEPPTDEFTCIPTVEEEEDIVRAPNQLHIESACKILPHPDKIEWGGEDAIFLHERTFGIFDGVSGAHKQSGVPLYSITLAKQMQKLVIHNHDNIDAITQKEKKDRSVGLTMSKLSSYLEQSIDYADQFATGASTAIVASLGEDNYLRVLNIGDSTLIVIRDSEVVARSEDIVHFFNCPYQFAVYSTDSPSDGTKMNVEIIPGDVIVMASDGVFDNLDNQAIIDAVERDSKHASRIVKNIVEDARKISLDPEAETPFGMEEKKSKVEQDDLSCVVDEVEGFGLGGKIDDISCVVLRILSAS